MASKVSFSACRLTKRADPRILSQFNKKHSKSSLLSHDFSSTSQRDFDPSNTNKFADHCDLNLVYSPYPDVSPGPYPAVAEFVMQHWTKFNPAEGHLGQQTAIRDTATGLTRTFDDYYDITTQVAAVLAEDFKIQEDSCVALYCPNHVDFLPVSLAVSLCGAKLTPINPMYTRDEVSMVLQKSRSSVMFVHTSKLDVALESVKDCPNITQIVVINDHGEAIPEGTMVLQDLLTNPDKRVTETHQGMHPNTRLHPYLLPYSSGTTGAPKGVCLTHSNIVINLHQFHEVENISFPQVMKLLSFFVWDCMRLCHHRPPRQTLSTHTHFIRLYCSTKN